MGCLTANGREHLLESSRFNSYDGATDYPLASVGGTYAGVVVHGSERHYIGSESETVDVFDLRTGARSGFGGESSSCPSFEFAPCGGIDQLLIGQNGLSAAHVDPGPRGDSIGVSCGSPSFCLTYNGYGDVSSSTNPANGPWSSAQVGTQLQKVSCPSASLCVGVNNGSTIYASANPTGGSGTWTKTEIPGVQRIYDLSCPSTTLCVASGTGGKVLVATDPAGGPSAWSVDAVDGADTAWAVSCPTASECFAQDGVDVISSSNPSGGASAWTVHHNLLDRAFRKISCPSSSLCLGAPLEPTTGLLMSTDPTANRWTTTNSSFLAWDVACPSTSLCVAVGQSGVSVSTNPSSGDWTTYPLIDTPQSVSCPTATFCMIGAIGTGYAFTSTDPAGGAGTWKPVLADRIDCASTPLACRTEQIVASDRTGVHTLDSSTEFEAQTGSQLTGLTISGNTLGWNSHGSPASAELRP
jgi:hypothetical protein